MLKKDFKVPNHPKIYKVMEMTTSGRWRPTGVFRVRKRYLEGEEWKTFTQTFSSFDQAKECTRSPYVPPLITKSDDSDTFEVTFKRFMVHKEAMKLSQGTLDGYWNRYVHLKFFEGMRMREITPKQIDAWLNLLSDPEYIGLQQKGRSCYEHEYVLLSCFLRYFRNYVDETFVVPLLDRHRARATAKSKAKVADIRFLNAEEETAFLEGLRSHPLFYDIALFQLNTGARIGEAAAFQFSNVDYVRGEVRIVQHLYWDRKKGGQIKLVPGTKTGPTRNVPLTPECGQMLRYRQREAVSSIVFQRTNSNGWLNYRSIQEAYDRTFKKLGLPHRGTHVLRHTFAVRFLDQTKDVYALQKLLGHTDLETTQIYAKYSNESVRRSFQLFRGGLDRNSEGPLQNSLQIAGHKKFDL